jgi:hypothetical protein
MPHHAQFYHPYQIKIHPTKLFPSPSRADGLFDLSIRYGATEDWQLYSLVHIPSSVQYAFSEGLVQAFHLEYLPLNGAASWALPGSPQYAVLGVELADGSRAACVSPELHVAFKKKMFVAACTNPRCLDWWLDVWLRDISSRSCSQDTSQIALVRQAIHLKGNKIPD